MAGEARCARLHCEHARQSHSDGWAGECLMDDRNDTAGNQCRCMKFLPSPPVADSHRCSRPKCAGWKEMEPDEREGLDEKTFCDAEESSAPGRPCPRGQCSTDDRWHRECEPVADSPNPVDEASPCESPYRHCGKRHCDCTQCFGWHRGFADGRRVGLREAVDACVDGLYDESAKRCADAIAALVKE